MNHELTIEKPKLSSEKSIVILDFPNRILEEEDTLEISEAKIMVLRKYVLTGSGGEK